MPVITSQACKQANISMPSWMDMRYQDLTAYLSTHSQGQFATKEEIVLSGLSINGSSYADGSSSIKRSIYDRFRYLLNSHSALQIQM